MNWQVAITIRNSYRLQATNSDNYPYILQCKMQNANNFCKEVLCLQGEKSQLWEIF